MGIETGDDAGVFRISEELALVTTADVITPPVDDPELFGRIAAANALSDVYAMGGRPVTALNLVFFPQAKLEARILSGILAGAAEKVLEAGAALAGGHSVDDDEPKFGLAVTGLVDPRRVWRNSGAREGDALLLTKPLGSGVLFNANRKSALPDAIFGPCLDAVTTLNRVAAETLARFEVHAATDVTGFGLLGHALGMARGSGLTLRISFDALPFLAGAEDAYRRGITTKANAQNAAHAGPSLHYEKALDEPRRSLLIDPQTSGGLLVALPESEAAAAIAALHASGVGDARRVGEVTRPGAAPLVVS